MLVKSAKIEQFETFVAEIKAGTEQEGDAQDRLIEWVKESHCDLRLKKKPENFLMSGTKQTTEL
jgi:hypothetical protein